VSKGNIVFLNEAALALLKIKTAEPLLGRHLDQVLKIAEVNSAIDQFLLASSHATFSQCDCKCFDGSIISVELRHRLIHVQQQVLQQITLRSIQDVHSDLAQSDFPLASRLHEALHHEKEILEMIALDKPLPHILQDVCNRMERLLDNGSYCSIMLLDAEKHTLHLAAAPSLSMAFCEDFSLIPVETHTTSCATAILENQLTITEEIDSSTGWVKYKSLAAKHLIRSSWSVPIRTAFDVVLGTVTVFHAHPRCPSNAEQALIIDAVDLIALSIDKKKMEQYLEESEARYRSVVTNLSEGIMMIAPDGRILTCNPSAQRILKITDLRGCGRRHRYFKRMMYADGSEIRIGQDPVSTVLRTGEPIVNLSVDVELRDHTIVWLLINALPIRQTNNNTITSVLLSFTDTTAFRQAQRQLRYIATHDTLTSLPNRHQLHERLSLALSNPKTQRLAVLFLDLDRFKNVNDTGGHAAGDSLLCDVANRLGTCIRQTDLLARLGGDEFVIVVESFNDVSELNQLAERVLGEMREPFLIEGYEYHLGTSIGISIFPQDATDSATLLRCADSAMYLAKESGRNNYQFFTDELSIRAQHRYTLEKNLRRALIEQEFQVYFQPKVSLINSRIVGAEALIRWKTPDVGLMLPNEFIPISEEIGLILSIGKWVLEESCRYAKKWRDQYMTDFVISVNISPKQFQDPRLSEFIQHALRDSGLPPHALQLEITEGLLMGDVEQLLPVFTAIKQLGISISLDDFGTGFSSLSYLQRFPIDNLKIDRSFIHNIPHSQDSVVLTRAIIAMANALSMSVTAEGVENIEQMNFLVDSGCEEIQGYFFSKPLSPVDFEKKLLDHQPSEHSSF
jgi:diguanylate cyclase (GGDEF)-like protein/PAS domain S-box-containing protein